MEPKIRLYSMKRGKRSRIKSLLGFALVFGVGVIFGRVTMEFDLKDLGLQGVLPINWKEMATEQVKPKEDQDSKEPYRDSALVSLPRASNRSSFNCIFEALPGYDYSGTPLLANGNDAADESCMPAWFDEAEPLSEKTSDPVRFTLQVASFAKPHTAANYTRRLREKGYDAYFVAGKDSRGEKWYLVRVGIFDTIEEARSLAYRFSEIEPLEVLVKEVTHQP